jgi:Ran GTPase-activating protein (RanGAP) involved in mRNA processing and transport
VRRVGLDFDWSLFGIRLDDAARLSAGLRTTPSLSSLELSRCMLDDDCTRKLSEGLAMNSTVTHLSARAPTVLFLLLELLTRFLADLSHNKITDDGVRALARALAAPASVVCSLDLSDNQLRAHGAKALATLLQSGRALDTLGLGLNRLGDEGVRLLGIGVAASPSLHVLTLSANGLGPGAVGALAGLMRSAPHLTTLDLSSNQLGVEAGRELREAVEASPALRVIDLRQTGLSSDAITAIAVVARDRNAAASLQAAAGVLAALGMK